jgi:SET domain-containing protein
VGLDFFIDIPQKFPAQYFATVRRPLQCKKVATALVKSPVIDPRFACYRMVIRESRIHRRGVYALEQIPKGRKVIEYTGEKISRRETKKRGLGSITYLFTLDNYWTIDGAVGGSGAEIINHSCDPNLYTIILRGHILYMSRRVIRPGEELTVDYRFSDKLDPVRCRCGTRQCRGVINVNDK